MPGCAGDYLNPIPEWVEKGLFCMDCAWVEACRAYYMDARKGRESPVAETEAIRTGVIE